MTTEVIVEDQPTFIQDMIDYLEETIPAYSVWQAHDEDVYHEPPCILVWYIDDLPYTAHWGGIEDYDETNERLYYSHHSRVSFNIHCVSKLSYDEADRMSMDVIRVLRAPRSDPEHILLLKQMEHNIRFIPRTEIKRFYATVEEDFFRFIVAVTADMEWREYIEQPKITDIDYHVDTGGNITVDVLCAKAVSSKLAANAYFEEGD